MRHWKRCHGGYSRCVFSIQGFTLYRRKSKGRKSSSWTEGREKALPGRKGGKKLFLEIELNFSPKFQGEEEWFRADFPQLSLICIHEDAAASRSNQRNHETIKTAGGATRGENISSTQLFLSLTPSVSNGLRAGIGFFRDGFPN
jgi:hypothetical protein